MKFYLYAGPNIIGTIRPRGDSWALGLTAGEKLSETKVKSIFGACDFLLRETAAISCSVFEFELVKIQS